MDNLRRIEIAPRMLYSLKSFSDMEIPKNFSAKLSVNQKTIVSSGIPKNFLLAALAFLILAGALYLLMAGYQKLATGQIENLDREIQDTVASLSSEEVERVLIIDAQLKGLRRLLPSHIFVSQIFSLLENNTNPQVTFTSLDLNVKENSIQLEGRAPSLTDISVQVAALKGVTYVTDVSLSDIKQETASYAFRMEVIFKKDLVLLR